VINICGGIPFGFMILLPAIPPTVRRTTIRHAIKVIFLIVYTSIAVSLSPKTIVEIWELAMVKEIHSESIPP
jgi:hypothetical protein